MGRQAGVGAQAGVVTVAATVVTAAATVVTAAAAAVPEMEVPADVRSAALVVMAAGTAGEALPAGVCRKRDGRRQIRCNCWSLSTFRSGLYLEGPALPCRVLPARSARRSREGCRSLPSTGILSSSSRPGTSHTGQGCRRCSRKPTCVLCRAWAYHCGN